MTPYTIIATALVSLGANKLRAGLTLLGIACLWAGAGTSQWEQLTRGMDAGSAAMTVTGGGLLLTGLAVRAGVVPFHYWVGGISAGCAPSQSIEARRARAAPPGGKSWPFLSSARKPSACAMPTPASLVAESPRPTRMRR